MTKIERKENIFHLISYFNLISECSLFYMIYEFTSDPRILGLAISLRYRDIEDHSIPDAIPEQNLEM